MTVSLGNGVDIGNLVTSEINPLTGGIELLVAGVSVDLPSPNRNTCVLVGDSLADYCTQDGTSLTPTPTQIINQDIGWMHHLNVLSGQAFSVLDNLGVGGARLWEGATLSIAEQTAAAVALRPGWVFMDGGTNDIVAESRTWQEAVADAKLRIAELQAGGAKVVYLNIPCRTAGSGGTSAKMQSIMNFNAWLREYQYTVQNLIVVDSYAVNVVPTTGVPAANYLQADGTHQTNLMAYQWAQAIWAKISKFVAVPDVLISSNLDRVATEATSTNILTQPLFQGAGGAKSATGGGAAPTGTVASGWTVDREVGSTGTIACAVNARADGFGNNQNVVCAGMAAGDKVTIKCDTYHANTASGDSLVATIQAALSGVTGLTEAYVSVIGQNNILNPVGPYNVFAYDGFKYAFTPVAYPTTFAGGIYKTRPLKLLGTQTQVQLRVSLVFAAGGGATLDLSRASLRKVIG